MNADARDNQLVLNPPPDVAHAPSNVKDAAGGKSFTFIPIVIRNGMGTLLRAVSRLVSTPRLVGSAVADGVLPMTRTNADKQFVLNLRSSAFIGGQPIF